MEQYRGVLEHCLICKGETWNIANLVSDITNENTSG